VNTDKLTRIRAKCVELLAIAERRSKGAWEYRFNLTYDRLITTESGAEDVALLNSGNEIADGNNATFIASCAGTAEAGWKATIAAIDECLSSESWDGDLRRSYIREDAERIAESIEAAWLEELL
jgi:hypothetical protein